MLTLFVSVTPWLFVTLFQRGIPTNVDHLGFIAAGVLAGLSIISLTLGAWLTDTTSAVIVRGVLGLALLGAIVDGVVALFR